MGLSSGLSSVLGFLGIFAKRAGFLKKCGIMRLQAKKIG